MKYIILVLSVLISACASNEVKTVEKSEPFVMPAKENCISLPKDIAQLQADIPKYHELANKVGGSIDEAEADSLFGNLFAYRLVKKNKDQDLCMRVNNGHLEHMVIIHDDSHKPRWSKTNVAK
ncbi:MAG: hypothetical protein MI808_19960 [Pseudomonadales bacterium]|nr:hypothetical protein [Pseudomonadales bacterium]